MMISTLKRSFEKAGFPGTAKAVEEVDAFVFAEERLIVRPIPKMEDEIMDGIKLDVARGLDIDADDAAGDIQQELKNDENKHPARISELDYNSAIKMLLRIEHFFDFRGDEDLAQSARLLAVNSRKAALSKVTHQTKITDFFAI